MSNKLYLTAFGFFLLLITPEGHAATDGRDSANAHFRKCIVKASIDGFGNAKLDGYIDHACERQRRTLELALIRDGASAVDAKKFSAELSDNTRLAMSAYMIVSKQSIDGVCETACDKNKMEGATKQLVTSYRKCVLNASIEAVQKPSIKDIGQYVDKICDAILKSYKARLLQEGLAASSATDRSAKLAATTKRVVGIYLVTSMHARARRE